MRCGNGIAVFRDTGNVHRWHRLDGLKRAVTLFNKGAEAIFGYSASEVIGKNVDILMPPRFHNAHANHMERFGEHDDQDRQMSPVRPIVGIRKDGTEFPIEVSISKLTLKGNKIYTSILRDRCKAGHQAEELLRQMHAQLEKECWNAPPNWNMPTQR